MTGEPGRILAIDLGAARAGLALSDPLGITAQPAGMIPRTGAATFLKEVERFVRDHGVSRVVVGHPLLLSGLAGDRARDAERFASGLREDLPDVPVELWDERFSTAEVERTLIAANVSRRKRRQVVDALAAVVILQAYMESLAERDRAQ